MHYTIVAFVLVCLSVGAAFVAKPQGARFSSDWRWFIAWIVVAAIGIFVPLAGAGFGALAVALLALAPLKPVARVCFFVAVFTALPTYYRFNLPFPGLNYLLVLDYTKLASLIMLAPLLPAALGRPAARLRALDWLVALFVLLKCVMAARGLPITSVVRYSLDLFIVMLVPYFVVSRIIQSKDDVSRVFDAFFVALLIHASIGVFSTWRHWNFYSAVVGFDGAFDARGGFLRLTSTLNPMLLGTLMAIGGAGTLELIRREAIAMPRLLFYCLLFAAITYLTESRGAILAAGAILLTYAVFTHMKAAARAAYLWGGAAALLILPGVLLNSDFSSIDPYGTFSYRAELVRASMTQFREHPWLGSFDFGRSPHFAHLIQGTGTVDFVNAYLQVALEYGAAGLLLFVGMAVSAVLGFAGAAGDLHRRGGADDARELKGLVGWVGAYVVGLLTILLTVSLVSYANQLLFVAFGLTAAAVRAAGARAARAAEPSAAAAAGLAASPAPTPPLAPARDLPAHLRGYPKG